MEHLSLRRHIALEIDRILQNRLIERHPLRQLFWECTLRCNLHCRHCGSDCHTDSKHADMPVADFLRVLDVISQHQNPNETFIIVTGGEPLLRKDLEECGREFYRRGFPWGMVTNGMELTRSRLNSLIQSGLHSLTISLDGFEADHNWMRGSKIGFNRAAEAIHLVNTESDLINDVVTCVNTHNFSTLPQFKNYLIELGVKRWRLFTVFPAGRAKDDEELQLSPHQLRELMQFIASSRKEKHIDVSYGCESFLGNYEGEVRDHFFTCQAGVTVGSIRCNGDIGGCLSIRSDYTQGNIYHDDFMEVWNKRFEPYRNYEWKRNGKCANCRFFRYCRGNGMHLRKEDGHILVCNYKRMFPDKK